MQFELKNNSFDTLSALVERGKVKDVIYIRPKSSTVIEADKVTTKCVNLIVKEIKPNVKEDVKKSNNKDKEDK